MDDLLGQEVLKSDVLIAMAMPILTRVLQILGAITVCAGARLQLATGNIRVSKALAIKSTSAEW